MIFTLKKYLPPNWHIQAIDELSEIQVASVLWQSRIFLSFSGLEGLGLPPIEAALCGNYVIGYHGGGGREYWLSPNFDSVEVGDIAGFVKKVCTRVAAIERDPTLLILQAGIDHIRESFSAENEKSQLKKFVNLLKADYVEKEHGLRRETSFSIKLQKRRKIIF